MLRSRALLPWSVADLGAPPAAGDAAPTGRHRLRAVGLAVLAVALLIPHVAGATLAVVCDRSRVPDGLQDMPICTDTHRAYHGDLIVFEGTGFPTEEPGTSQRKTAAITTIVWFRQGRWVHASRPLLRGDQPLPQPGATGGNLTTTVSLPSEDALPAGSYTVYVVVTTPLGGERAQSPPSPLNTVPGLGPGHYYVQALDFEVLPGTRPDPGPPTDPSIAIACSPDPAQCTDRSTITLNLDNHPIDLLCVPPGSRNCGVHTVFLGYPPNWLGGALIYDSRQGASNGWVKIREGLLEHSPNGPYGISPGDYRIVIQRSPPTGTTTYVFGPSLHVVRWVPPPPPPPVKRRYTAVVRSVATPTPYGAPSYPADALVPGADVGVSVEGVPPDALGLQLTIDGRPWGDVERLAWEQGAAPRAHSFTRQTPTALAAGRRVTIGLQCVDCDDQKPFVWASVPLADVKVAAAPHPTIDRPPTFRADTDLTLHGRRFPAGARVASASIAGEPLTMLNPAPTAGGAGDVTLRVHVPATLAGRHGEVSLSVVAYEAPTDHRFVVSVAVPMVSTCLSKGPAKVRADRTTLAMGTRDVVTLDGAGFACSKKIVVTAGRPGAPDVDIPYKAETGIDGTVQVGLSERDLRPLLPLPAPTAVAIAIADETGRRAPAVSLTVVPAVYVIVTPATATPGQRVSVDAHGFTRTGRVTATFDDREVASRYLTPPDPFQVVVPDDARAGAHALTLRDTDGHAASAALTIVAAAPSPGPAPGPARPGPTVTLDPTTAGQGRPLRIVAGGFGANALLTIMLGPRKISGNADYTNGTGALTKNVVVPRSAPDGALLVSVTDAGGRKASATLTVHGSRSLPTLRVAPASGPAGVAVTLSGDGWDNVPRRAALRGPDAAADVPLPLDHEGRCDQVDKDPCAPGELRTTITIPAAAIPGRWTIAVMNDFARVERPFEVVKPAPPPGAEPRIALAPASGRSPSTVSIAAVGLTPNAFISVTEDDVPRSIEAGATTTDAAGGVAGAVVTVSGKPGPHTIDVRDGRGHRAHATFEILASAPPPPTTRPAPTPPIVPAPTPPPTTTDGAPPCRPNAPRYSQPGCREVPAPPSVGPPSTPNPGTAPADAPPCRPNAPRYSQPGCRDVPSAPSTGAWKPPSGGDSGSSTLPPWKPPSSGR